jgi:CheY-like chemotaxis protein
MYLRKFWDVLIVDDAPDVLAITRLALKNLKVYGIPLKIHEYPSKEAAVAHFKKKTELPDFALAMLDVVMESNQAGLELCDFIRNTQNNRVSTIVIRTGQPGAAAENDVMEKYDINQYINKVEASELELRHIATTAVRQFLYARLLEGALMFATRFSEARTLAELKKAVSSQIDWAHRYETGEGIGSITPELGFFLGDDYIGAGKYANVKDAKAKREELLKTPEAKLREHRTENGNRYLRVGDDVFLTAPTTDGRKPVEFVAHTTYSPMPDWLVGFWWSIMNNLSNALWRLS